jgi:DNA polymerase I-like protein with 3'-5' exonuclease and polymerase domains
MALTLEDIDIGDVSPEHLIEASRERGHVVWDLETTGLDPHNDRIEGIAFYVPEGPKTPPLRAWYPFVERTMEMFVQPDETMEEQSARLRHERTKLPADYDSYELVKQTAKLHDFRPAMCQEGTMEGLRPLFEGNPETVLVAHNVKFDMSFMRYASGCKRGFWDWERDPDVALKVKPWWKDTDEKPKDYKPWMGSTLADSMLADFLGDENHVAYGLKRRVRELFGHDMTTYQDVMKRRKQGYFGFMADDVQALGHYAMEDVYWTWCLYKHAMLKLEELTPGEPIYAGTDVVTALGRLSRVRPSHFDNSRSMGNLERLFWGIDMPLAVILEEMESTGVLIDDRWLRKVTEQLEIKKEKILTEIEESLGYTINPNSAPQVATILFAPAPTGLGLSTKYVAQTATGMFSTGSKEIGHLKRAHPVVEKILDWRSADTVQGNFSEKLTAIACESHDGRVHSGFNQTGTKIYRLSSSNPINMQNQPRDKNLIRKAFCAYLEGMDEDMLLFGCDYSQVELRVAAHLSGDLGMIEVYNMVGGCKTLDGQACENYKKWVCEDCDHKWIPVLWDCPNGTHDCPGCGSNEHTEHQKRCRHVDLHQRTAEDVGVPRNPLAKNANFGLLYRMASARFCQYADLYDAQGEPRIDYADELIEGWFQAYPAIEPFHLKTEEALRRNNWVAYTIAGRQRRLSGERWRNEYRAITQGIQFQVSGSAQDILKIAMKRIFAEIKWRLQRAGRATRKLWAKVRFLIQVHDEVILEGPVELKDEIMEIINRQMCGAASLQVPLVADCKWGRCWDHIH